MAKERKQLNEADISRVLESSTAMGELILRFAWNAGLSSGEMRELKWENVSFETGELCLPDRTVPMEEGLLLCLQQQWKMTAKNPAEYILASGSHRTQMHRVYLCRLAREALDAGGLTEVNLMDLRNGFVIRQLEKNDWPYVARISGLSLTTLRRNFSGCCPDSPAVPAAETEVTEECLYKLLEQEGASPVGLAVALSWRAGLRGTELAALTWEQVDFDAGRIRLEDRDEPMDEDLARLLRQAYENRVSDEERHVLLTPKTNRPMSDGHLSRMVRNAMIRAGMDDLTLGVLAKKYREEQDAPILSHVQKHGFVTRDEAVELLGVSERQAWKKLHSLVEQGRLVKIGRRYHAAGTVIPPEAQYGVIRDYLTERGGAYRQELAELLHVEPRSCGWILHGLVQEGKLSVNRQWYTLPEEKS